MDAESQLSDDSSENLQEKKEVITVTDVSTRKEQKKEGNNPISFQGYRWRRMRPATGWFNFHSGANDAAAISLRGSRAKLNFPLPKLGNDPPIQTLPVAATSISHSYPSSISSSASSSSIERRLGVKASSETKISPSDNMLKTIQSLIQTGHLTLGEQALKLSLRAAIDSKLSVECLNCLLYLSLFPKDYEIERDTMIQLWMGAHIIKEEPMEVIGVGYLKALENSKCVSLLREDHGSGMLWYKVNPFTLSENLSSRINHFCVDRKDEDAFIISSTTEPVHLTVVNSPANLEFLKKLSEMKTLLFLHGHESRIKHIPYDFFTSSLSHMTVLSLSETNLSEVPSSIGNLRDLRYLDLSKTLIKQLPETIGCLQQLQTLKLKNCPNLIQLPKRTNKLTSLRHLDFGKTSYLHSMPCGIGALTCLRTLSEFPVGFGNGYGLAELKNLVNLRGKLCLSRLQNVATLQARQASLHKLLLEKLELRWTPRQRAKIRLDDDVIFFLRPQRSLEELRIVHYGGILFPRWISDPSFDKLVSFTMFKCENCSFLPSLGNLPSLKSLNLTGLTQVRIIDNFFCGDIVSSGDKNNYSGFPNLQNLAIQSMLNLEKWQEMTKCHFPPFQRLVKLTVKDCPKLVSLCTLSNRHLLQYLEISGCPQLPCLSEGYLPASLKKLVIEDCPLLKISCSKRQSKDWHKIKHVDSVWLDYEEISVKRYYDSS